MKRCNHDRVYACRAETEEVVTAFFLVCVKCTMIRGHSEKFLGLFHPWIKQNSPWYPEGARFTVLAGPNGNEKTLKEAVVEAIQQLAEKEKEAAS